jgi:hypothetical protein
MKEVTMEFPNFTVKPGFRHTLDLLGQKRLDPRLLVTHHISLDEPPEMAADWQDLATVPAGEGMRNKARQLTSTWAALAATGSQVGSTDMSISVANLAGALGTEGVIFPQLGEPRGADVA